MNPRAVAGRNSLPCETKLVLCSVKSLDYRMMGSREYGVSFPAAENRKVERALQHSGNCISELKLAVIASVLPGVGDFLKCGNVPLWTFASATAAHSLLTPLKPPSTHTLLIPFGVSARSMFPALENTVPPNDWMIES